MTAFAHTSRPLGHYRARRDLGLGGMFFNFACAGAAPDRRCHHHHVCLAADHRRAVGLDPEGARARLPLDARSRVGFVGVVVMLWPHLDVARYTGAAASAATLGALFAMGSAFADAGSVVQTRRLTDTETTSSIVLYFSLFCALGGLVTLPFGWIVPNGLQLTALILLGVFGGLSHILLTESYRYAPASLVAPLDYTALFWAFILGYWFFDELPTPTVYFGAAIITAAVSSDLARAPARPGAGAQARAAAGPPTGAHDHSAAASFRSRSRFAERAGRSAAGAARRRAGRSAAAPSGAGRAAAPCRRLAGISSGALLRIGGGKCTLKK